MCLREERFGNGESCGDCHLNVQFVDEVESQCVFPDDDNCYVIFNFDNSENSGNETVLIRKEKRKLEMLDF